jgi:hypothetical protein
MVVAVAGMVVTMTATMLISILVNLIHSIASPTLRVKGSDQTCA